MTLSTSNSVYEINTLRELDESGLLIFTGSESLRTTTFNYEEDESGDSIMRHLVSKVFTAHSTTEFHEVS